MENSQTLPCLSIPEAGKNVGDNTLQLSKIIINEDYRKEWNIKNEDFVCLTKNGELVSNSLYRVGGMGADIKKDYFLLLKYVEAICDFKFVRECYKDKSNKEVELLRKHLKGCWCIIDKNGIEKKQFDQFDSPYIVSDSCIYSFKSNYYNIETGEFYCYASSAIKSADYLFLENAYGKDESRRGVMKINKKDGSWELFA